MSKDIRSWFQVVKPKNKPEKKVELSDDDVIPESPDVQIKNKKKESRKKRVLEDSSDEEIFSKKKPKTTDGKTKTPTPTKDKKKPDKDKKPLKEVKAVDIFGGGPIKRTEPLVKKEKKLLKTEIGIHDDDDFEKSLLEIDEIIDSDIVSANGDDRSKDVPAVTKEIHEEKSSYFNGETSKGKKEDVAKSKPPKKHEATDKKSEEKVSKVEEQKPLTNGKSAKAKSSETKETSSENKSKEKLNGELSKHKSSKKSDKSKEIPSEDKPKHKELSKIHSEETITITDDETESKDKSPKPKSFKIPKIKTESSNSTSDSKSKDDKKSPKKNGLSSKDVKVEKRGETSVKSKLAAKLERSDKKRDFSEFINDDLEETPKEEEVEVKPKNKKKKLDVSLNSSVISDEERHERKRHSAALYQSYLNRSGPKNLGAKEIPEGSPNCLKDCAFLLTGVLESFERDEVAEAIKKYGGTVKSGISKKVTHVLAGDDAGPAKLAKAEELGIRVINEDEFLTLINDLSNPTKPGKAAPKNTEKVNKDEPKNKEKDKNNKDKQSKSTEKSKEKAKVTEDKMKSYEEKIKKNFYAKTKETPLRIESSPDRDTQELQNERVTKLKFQEAEDRSYASTSSSNATDTKSESSSAASITPAAGDSLMWVDKYKPQTVKQIIGQHGDASNVKKLMNWLTKWYINRKEKIPKPSPWAKNDDGAYYKAALLSGPPGVGKTTAVTLVCKELGFDTVEFNASDTRSKTLIKEQIGELLTTTSLSGFAKGNTGKSAVTKKHVLVMDEVDGMAGNEDRGGLQELISLIKTTGVPIICMCNDRNSEKMRTLVNYCFDLKFTKPRVDQIKSAMLSICFKEKIKIPPDTLTQLIVACSQDVRQTLTSLSMYAANPGVAEDTRVKKDIKLGPWEVIRKVFSAEDHKTMSINDKSDLFFYDYSIAPLFVQENYLSVAPHCPKNEILDRVSQAADSISLGDLVESRIRRSQAWNLLPIQAMFSSVTPGTVLSGHVSGQIQFPGWLGKNSRRNKMQRLAQEIHAHTRLSTTGSKSSIFLDYARYLRDAIVTPLVKLKSEGISGAIDVLSAYHLPREDLDSLTELATWPGQRDPMILVDSKVKAAMTRTYNKQAPALPYAAPSFTKSKRNKEDGRESGTEDEQNSDAEGDGMIKKVKKKKESTKSSTKKEAEPSTSKGKKGRGKK